MEAFQLKRIQYGLKQKIYNKYPACALTHNHNIGISGMRIHPSHRRHLHGHVLAELENNLLGLEGIGDDVTITTILVVLID